MTFDVKAIRKDFPILERKVRGKPLVYLDNAATTQRPVQVIEAMNDFYRNHNANVHRSIHLLGEEATEMYVGAHAKVAEFIRAPSAEEIIFTKNCTEALNLVAYAWGLRKLKPGDEVVVSLMEHHSNFVPWQQICKMTGAKLVVAPITATGELDMAAYAALLKRGTTKMVALTAMSNVLGTITAIKEAVRLAHEVGALALVDGAQSVPHVPTDVKDMDADFLAFSGHKMLGPTGIGVLFGKREILEKMDPFLFGGEMILRVTVAETKWNVLPWKYEAGTPNICEGVGLAAAIDYLTKLGMANVQQHERELTRYAMKRLADVKGITIYGPPAEKRGGVVSFTMEDIHAHDLASLIDEAGVAIRAGHHCAQPLMQHLDIPSAARASFYIYNEPHEVDVLAEVLENSRGVFKL
ncbi:MAG: aminotransferase class V-fold PLP-dependent enzyme [Thermoplasmatota archaeon]